MLPWAQPAPLPPAVRAECLCLLAQMLATVVDSEKQGTVNEPRQH
jgi:hypothetical protein